LVLRLLRNREKIPGFSSSATNSISVHDVHIVHNVHILDYASQWPLKKGAAEKIISLSKEPDHPARGARYHGTAIKPHVVWSHGAHGGTERKKRKVGGSEGRKLRGFCGASRRFGFEVVSQPGKNTRV